MTCGRRPRRAGTKREGATAARENAVAL